MCPQAGPGWINFAEEFLATYLTTGKVEVNATELQAANGTAPTVTAGGSQTEDCLFLDVWAPSSILAKSADASTTGIGKGSPVLVWIYGGGYTEGDKLAFMPQGLLARSFLNDGEGVIYVAMNYRLGAFGWLAGPSLQADGTANAGLYDQRAALDWVQEHISKFGGDPSRVTVIGESAGAGSIMHQ